MTFTGKTARIAVAAAVTGAMLLPATGALAASKTERALVGALIGGAAGAALGRGDGGAVAVGAAAGALIGVATDKDRRYHRSYNQRRPYYRDARYYDRGDYGRDYNGYGRYDTSYGAPYGYYGR
ncbi:hypothetical protein [Phenylobacterium sp.]|jgi:hypothetical protein|uniref:hypothetical protein n=1 Tax=Phenylobacterium sp. TaxID=1871053 RepID=UPI002F3EE121